ncbi:MAG TPA: hypothetical protein EYN60_03325 [Nitrospirales bacterium]|nr:hypothetical protein [Nitrospirales bacterium]
MKCWAGCSLDEICDALGISVRDLFYDTDCVDSGVLKQRADEKRATQRHERTKLEVDARYVDALREADCIIQELSGLSIDIWTDVQRHQAMSIACDACSVLLAGEGHV